MHDENDTSLASHDGLGSRDHDEGRELLRLLQHLAVMDGTPHLRGVRHCSGRETQVNTTLFNRDRSLERRVQNADERFSLRLVTPGTCHTS